MRYKIDRLSHMPAYMQLYIHMREDIVNGIYPYGTRLPSKRFIAAEIGISLVTVEHTYAILVDEGYVETRQRSGYFVIYREADLVPVGGAETAEAEYRKDAPAFGRAEESEEDEMPFTVLARTMRRVISLRGEDILVKSQGSGIPELREAIASYLLRSRNIRIKPEQVVIGSGAEYLYSLIVQLLGRDRLYALEDPSYEKIHRMYTANGAECEILAMGPEGIRSEALARSKAQILHVTPFNSYPSGITATASKRREYIRWAKERGGVIIEDDFDSEFTISTKTADTLFSLEPERTVIYLNTFSMTVAPSMRIGYMILPEQMIERFRETIGFYSCTVSTFEQYVLTELINSGDFERHINSVRRRRRKAQQN